MTKRLILRADHIITVLRALPESERHTKIASLRNDLLRKERPEKQVSRDKQLYQYVMEAFSDEFPWHPAFPLAPKKILADPAAEEHSEQPRSRYRYHG